jgi:predicted kinase
MIVGMFKLTIMRGLPGSGKSTLAKKQGGLVLSADDYFVLDGEYTWDSAMLGPAHRWNIWRCRIAMERATPHIVIDNVNAQLHEAKEYVKLAIKHNYEVTILEVTTPWCKDAEELAERCTHDVPREKLEEILARWDEDYTVENILKSEAPWEKNIPRASLVKCHLGFHDWSRWGYPRFMILFPDGMGAHFQHRRCFRCGKDHRRRL